MLTAMMILFVLAAVLLIGAVLLQPGKGSGLSGGFGGGAAGQISTMFGARRTADFLQKFTFGLAIGILILILVTNKFLVSPAVVTNAAGGDERTPITVGASKPAPQPVQQAPATPQAQPQQQAPAQAAPAQGKPQGK